MFARKIFLSIALLLVSVTVCSAPVVIPTSMQQPQQPNSFELSGGSIHISYTTSGIDGQPHLSYRDAKRKLSFSGSEIRTVETEVGTMVNVTTTMTVDTGSVTFSIIVPNINLGSTLNSLIRTQGIETIHKFSVIPSFNIGQRDTYKFYNLIGNAKFVVF